MRRCRVRRPRRTATQSAKKSEQSELCKNKKTRLCRVISQKVVSESEPSRGRSQPSRRAERDFLRKVPNGAQFTLNSQAYIACSLSVHSKEQGSRRRRIFCKKIRRSKANFAPTLVRPMGLEPIQAFCPLPPQSSASAYSATAACLIHDFSIIQQNLRYVNKNF